MERKIEDIFKEIFGVSEITEKSSRYNNSAWNSLKHIQLIVALEKRFGIEITFDDSLKITSLKDTVLLLKKYKINKDEITLLDHLLAHQRIDNEFVIEYNNIYELFKNKLDENSGKSFIVFPEEGKTFTYNEFYKETCNAAFFLEQLKIKKSDKINLVIPNSSDFVILYFAALIQGIIVVPINSELSPPEIAYIIKDSQSKAVFYHPSLSIKIEEVRKTIGYSALFYFSNQRSKTNDFELNLPKVEPTDIAVIIYTSGTTGNPKGAVITHLNILSDAQAISGWFQFTPDTRTLCILPLFHNNGQIITLISPLYTGGSTVVVQSKVGLTSFWKLINDYEVNWTSVMPSILSILLSVPLERKDNTMKGIICGGQILNPEVQKSFENRFKVPIFEGYGLTETTSFACFNKFPQHLRKEGSVGIELPINMISIRNEEDNEVAPREEGEICIKGLNVVNEYYHLKEKNKQVFRNGWFHSGDFGFKDNEGNIYFKTRKDFLIIRGGENIYPSEIENALFMHPAVAECAVIGIPSKLLGEDICAFVKLHSHLTITEQELKLFLKDKIAGFKIPVCIIIINNIGDLEEIPKGPTKKILYRKLKEYYLNNLYTLEE